jgi:hypothetical protein
MALGVGVTAIGSIGAWTTMLCDATADEPASRAKALGLDVPFGAQQRADEVIE